MGDGSDSEKQLLLRDAQPKYTNDGASVITETTGDFIIRYLFVVVFVCCDSSGLDFGVQKQRFLLFAIAIMLVEVITIFIGVIKLITSCFCC